MRQVHELASDIPAKYEACALYFEESDILEYVRVDVPSFDRRVDESLTIVLSLQERQPIGFCLKGFKNFYLRHLQAKHDLGEKHFLLMIDVLQDLMTVNGDAIFGAVEKSSAYRQALEIAQTDNVKVVEFPQVA